MYIADDDDESIVYSPLSLVSPPLPVVSVVLFSSVSLCLPAVTPGRLHSVLLSSFSLPSSLSIVVHMKPIALVFFPLSHLFLSLGLQLKVVLINSCDQLCH